MDVPDHGPLIVAVTWALTALSGGFLGLRIYAKLSRKQGLWWDDHILLSAWVLLLAEAAVTQAGQILGFGKRIQDIPSENIGTIGLGAAVLATVSSVTVTLSKLSFGATLLRITSGYIRWIVWFCIGSLLVITIPCAISPWIQCPTLATSWNVDPNACWDSDSAFQFGVFNSAWSAATDFALALLPWPLIWRIQLKFREKIGVSIAMSMGMLAGICAIIRGVYQVQLQDKDFSYNGVDLVIWTSVETATAIIGGCIPVLRVFFKETISSHSRSTPRAAANPSVPLSRLHRSQHSTITTVQAGTKGDEAGWTAFQRDGDTSSQKAFLDDDEEMGRVGTAMSGDIGIMQTNTVTVTVENDTRSTYKARSFIGSGK
ncbi:hypothetical protein ACJQWK_09309 [Exserohilum turcicum]|uniref:Rhodopsin domain-containing protein n=1 Tax=Exserohilum turcicum (strain 28A) TaxID=671987 RepID=R0KMT5_EXST2|nr:uncharacterized protein SETTUDRAFT_167781 [Exserohilum turcica Et28A]EOA89242.1 hypothetical protein SETTUDRAFT_167781 [Exserohilum turcica Et28A]